MISTVILSSKLNCPSNRVNVQIQMSKTNPRPVILSPSFGEGSNAAERWVVTDPSLRPDGKEVGTAFRMTKWDGCLALDIWI